MNVCHLQKQPEPIQFMDDSEVPMEPELVEEVPQYLLEDQPPQVSFYFL